MMEKESTLISQQYDYDMTLNVLKFNKLHIWKTWNFSNI